MGNAVQLEIMSLFNLESLLLLAASTLADIIIGALPGLTATMGVSLLVSTTLGLGPANALVVMVGVFLGGIYGGIFTPTECSVVGVVYTLLVGKFVYHELTLKKLKESLVEAAITSATIMIIFGPATTFGRLLTPVGGGGGGPVYAVVPASGDGAHLEQDVKGLLWLRGGELARFTIVIADGGLDGTGRAVAAALLARGQGIVLCPAERLGEYIKA